jgi:hypothetical protein
MRCVRWHSVFEWLRQKIFTIKFRINFLKLENALLACITYKLLAEINMLSTITATNRALGPMNARLIVSKNRSRTILLETKIIKKLEKEDNFLNHGTSCNELSFSLDKANTE